MLFLKKKIVPKQETPIRPSLPANIFLDDSLSLAIDFFFRAIYGKLPEKMSKEIIIDKKYKDIVYNFISVSEKRILGHENYRSVYFATQETALNSPFCVELIKHSGVDHWDVVGFMHPRENCPHYYAVFEPHDWFGWKTESFEYVDSY